ncbi:MAG: RdgB/HAM1 family non-canonical purine NTP pyrophosphatase [Flavobacteriales bacterium]|nr:RdgB/HAM1 family non-canonical purine NTP pyrophosphatase [Flavobacteriales bacterium]
MELVFATHNAHKAREIAAMLPDGYTMKTLDEIGLHDEIPETGSTLEENSRQKVDYVLSRCTCNCFADDTGLMVDALGGAPGVYSARYAGESATYEDNVNKLLDVMNGIEERGARFATVITLSLEGEIYTFTGSVEGEITTSASGNEGFGYDPIFLPRESDRTFAQMTMDEKASISHRGRAFAQMIDFLKHYKTK